MSKFMPKKHFFPNQDRHDVIGNISTEIGNIEHADMGLKMNTHPELFGVKTKTMVLTINLEENL
jgi:hypothetical protein